jgi:hypothetical protein
MAQYRGPASEGTAEVQKNTTKIKTYIQQKVLDRSSTEEYLN